MIDMLGQSSVHSVVFHEEVCVDTCVLEFENKKIIYFGEAHFQCKQSWFFATIIFTASSNFSDHCSLQSNMFMRQGIIFTT